MGRGHSKIKRTKGDRQWVEPTERGAVRAPQSLIICAVIVFLVALVLYGWTLAPTVTFIDSGELIVVARSLGVAHPPGTPLWVMLAHLVSLLPWGNVALRINFSSALFAAFAAAMLTLVTAELIMIAALAVRRKGGFQTGPTLRMRATGSVTGEESLDQINPLLVLVPASGSGLLLAFSHTLWSYATITEVYSLNVLLIIAVFFLMLKWQRRILAHRWRVGAVSKDRNPSATTEYDIFLYGAALVFGLALGVHHVTVALTLPALGVLVCRTEGWGFFRSRRMLYAGLVAGGALLAVYSYLPLAAARSPIINWGNPCSLQEIWWHVTGRQYQVYLAFTLESFGTEFLQFIRMALREYGSPWIPLTLGFALAGLADLFKRDRTSFWFLTVLFLADVAYALTYSIAEDKEAYYLPAFVSIAVAAGFGLRRLITLGGVNLRATWKTSLLAAAPVLLVAAVALAGNWRFNNRRQYFVAHDYVQNLFSAIGPNGLLLTFDWQVASPMLFAQEIERRRPDVRVIDINLLRRPWYFEYLRRSCPNLIERSRNEIDSFIGDLKDWERDPRRYEIDATLNQSISARFDEMIHAIVINESRVAPVYVTSDVLYADERGGEAIRWLKQSYQLVPEGLVFRLASDPAFHDSPDLKLETRGLADGTLRFRADDIVSLKILPVYTSMLINRGRYLARHNQHERAITAFREALVLNPDLSPAQQGLQESMGQLSRP